VSAETHTKPVPDHGIPEGAAADEPKGTPTSDRHHSETSASEKGGKAEADKHSYGKLSSASQWRNSHQTRLQ
jgi:hypothetical protein